VAPCPASLLGLEVVGWAGLGYVTLNLPALPVQQILSTMHRHVLSSLYDLQLLPAAAGNSLAVAVLG
jgi:hypothetical protein